MLLFCSNEVKIVTGCQLNFIPALAILSLSITDFTFHKSTDIPAFQVCGQWVCPNLESV